MHIGNLSGRLALFTEAGAVDVEKASGGRFSSDPQAIYEVWDEFTGWAATTDLAGAADFDPADLGPPTPAPAQVFAIGLNYRAHAAESNLAVPDTFPPVFTKFRTSLSGPVTTVVLPPGGNVDWEVELVAVIGRRAQHVSAAGRLVLHRRTHSGTGHLGADHSAVRAGPPVQPRQVLPRVRPDRALGGDGRRIRRSR